MRKLHTIALLIAVTTALQGCHHSTDNDSQAKPLPCTSPVREISEDSTPRTQANPSSLADVRRPAVKVRAKKGCALLMETEGLRLATTDSAVLHAGVYSVTLLAAGETAPLPQGMVNMTASAEAYRLLPGGDHFRPGAELRVTYDPGRLPEGYTPDDIYTSYYDTASLAWVRLERVAVDTVAHEIVSLTTHFTDFINELVKAPEMPETQAFVPTAMTDLEAVSPLDGLTMVQPPTANNNGTANLSYPFIIPPGRGGMQPNLSLVYSSTGGRGWLGVGWDIPVPAITLDTRWGVPRYSAGKETEIYLLDGEQLIAQDSDGHPFPLPHRTNHQVNRLPDGTSFKTRFGDAHDSIIRHGDRPTNYWWEVIDRHGVTHFYGHYPDSSRQTLPVTLCDDRGNVARWPLCESRDLYGNTVRYYYGIDIMGYHGAGGRQLYLDSISYTGHGSIDGYYTVVFCRIPNATSDIPVVCNNGFKETTGMLLDNVYVKCGDSIQTAWVFTTEMSRNSNYKNRLSSITKIDTADGGIKWFLSQHCSCHVDSVLYTVVDSIVIKDPDGEGMITLYDTARYYVRQLDDIPFGYAGSTCRFSYYDLPPADSLFGVATESPLTDENIYGFLVNDPLGISGIGHATALGLSHSSSWNVGGTAAAGLGAAICLTSASLGGNYTRNQSASESLMTLVDLDGDGLADKVYVKDGKMYLCRHYYYDDGTIYFCSPEEIQGPSHFMREDGYSNTFGAQLAVGFSGSASWTTSKSTTSTYFADVNGDGLVDLVEDGQVWFNSLENGNPTFVLYEAPPLAEGEPDTARVFTSVSTCGGIIFDGKVNDSITCERIWVCDSAFNCFRDTADFYVQRYLSNPDTLINVEHVGEEEDVFLVKRHHREWDCSYHDDSPATEAVRVWVSPRDGWIHLNVYAGLIEDTSVSRRVARNADGVVYTLQHTSGVSQSGNRLQANANHILRTFDICDSCYYNENYPEYLYTLDTTLSVAKGDMLFFRLRSKNDRHFDNVYDNILIQYVSGDSARYDSKDGFVVSGNHCFQAPVDGYYEISGVYPDTSTRLEMNVGDSLIILNGPFLWRSGSIRKDATICFTVRSTNDTTDWSKVVCRPYVTFYPDSGAFRTDPNPTTGALDTSHLSGALSGWIPCQMAIKHGSDSLYDRPLLRRLFGPLYRGWGQFAYHSLDTGANADLIRVEKLVPPDMLVPGNTSQSDTVGLRESIHSGDTLVDSNLRGSTSLEEFQERHGLDLRSPLSYSSYWVEMTPDVEHQVWVSYGRQNHIGRTSISNTLQASWYSKIPEDTGDGSTGTLMSIDYDDAVPPPSANGTPAKVVRKVNRSESMNWSLGASKMGTSGSKGTNTIVTDYLDLNGDRYPDNIGIEWVQYSQPWGGLGELSGLHGKCISTTGSSGKSFCASPVTQKRVISGSQRNAMFTMESEGGGKISGGGNLGHDTTSSTWIDINGDGLADLVSSNGTVCLNIGYSFLNAERLGSNIIRRGISGSASVGYNGTLPDNFVNVWQGSIQVGAGISGSYNQTTDMLVDVNGDGLPDLVSRNIPEFIKLINPFDSIDVTTTVRYNLSNGQWSPPELLPIEAFHASTVFNESLNAGLTLGFTFWSVLKVTVGIDGSPYSGSVNRDYIQLVDVDADGLPDLVSSDSEDELTVRYNKSGRTNLLKEVVNPTGAGFQIDYKMSEPDYNQPSRVWLMTQVTTHDTLNRKNGATTTVTKYAYFHPHYDRYERTSYGYDSVSTLQIDPSDNSVYRIVEREYDNRSMIRKGKLTREMTSDGNGNPYVERIMSSSFIDYNSGDTVRDSDCPAMAYPVVEASLTNFYEGNATPQLTTGEQLEYDRYHNVVKYTDFGDILDPQDGLVATMEYYTSLPHNLVGLRKVYTVKPDLTSDPLRKAAFSYDTDRGSLVQYKLYNDSDSSVYDFSYDAEYGNLARALSPEYANGQRMAHYCTYDTIVHTYRTTIMNSFGEAVNTDYDYSFGKPTRVTDPSGEQMTYTYDFAGRLSTVTSPLDMGGHPTLEHHYYPTGYYHNGFNPTGYTHAPSPTGHPYSVSLHYDDTDNLITETAVLTNGSGKVIQTKKGLTVGDSLMMQVSGRFIADAFGRTVKQYDPVVEELSVHRGRYNSNRDTASLTITTYDVLDRATSTVQPLGVITQTDYSIGDDINEHRRFITTTTDPNGNVTTQYSDYEGRQVQVTDALGGLTLMQYDNMGQLLSASDPEGFTIDYHYDMLGHVVLRNHPDAGTTSYTYDGAGHPITETNPLGIITYDYNLGRLMHKGYSLMPGNDVSYTYDYAGRLESVIDGSGERKFSYDALGNVRSEGRTLGVPGTDRAFRFVTEYRHDSWGRMNSIIYPDGERVDYTYLWGGDLGSMHGEKDGNHRTYIAKIKYNSFGQKCLVKYGNGTKVQYAYDALHRLTNLLSQDGLGNEMQNVSYTFDHASNITAVENAAGPVGPLGGPYMNTYTYDGLHRLVRADGGFDIDMQYTPSGRLEQAWDGGNARLYSYCMDLQPHAPRWIWNQLDETMHELRRDDAGNLTQNSAYHIPDGEVTERYLYWTEDNRLHTVADGKHYSYYAYDHTGERALKMVGDCQLLDLNALPYTTVYEPEELPENPEVTEVNAAMLDKVTMYPSPYLVASSHGYTKHYYAGTERVAARIGSGGLLPPESEHESIATASDLYMQCRNEVDTRQTVLNNVQCDLNPDIEMYDIIVDVNGKASDRFISLVEMEAGGFLLAMTECAVNHTPEEPEVYFYHGDHLGSASWITDSNGNAVQHLQYKPFGEPYIDQRTSGYQERFTFTGKERDEETGYGYFGARYMDHELMTMWLSVDPLADKYPNISPYAYCAWNPVKLVDPDGQDWYDLYDDGTLVRNEKKSKKYQNSDVIWSVSNKTLSDEFSLGTLSEQRRDEKNGETGSYMSLHGSREENVAVFKFCSDNSNVEFSLMEIASCEDGTFTRLTTSHNERRVDVPSTDNYGSEYAKSEFFNLISHLHNHVGQARPSGDDESGDISYRNSINRLREISGKKTPVLWGIYKCRGNEKYTKDYDGNIIDPITMRPF